MAEELFIPKLGQTVEEVTLIRWLVKDGDKVKSGQEVMEVETDKANFPVESFSSGYIHFGPYREGRGHPGAYSSGCDWFSVRHIRYII